MTQTQAFRARTLAEAKRAVTAALGAEAVVLTTRRVPRNGLAGWFGSTDIEVVATVPPRASARSGAAPFHPEAYVASRPAPAAPPPAEVPSSRSDITALRTELRALKSAVSQAPAVNDDLVAELNELRQQLAVMATEPKKGDRDAALLAAAGIEGLVAAALRRAMKAREADAPPAERFRDALAASVRVAAWPLAGRGPVVVGLVGPTGVGKTTTAAKLAAQARLDGRSVTLVACDGYRVGAVDQLRRFAGLLGARFEEAPTREALARILAESATDVVIVDTAGRPPRKNGPEALLAPEDFDRATDGRRARHVLLCVPAALRASDAARLARTFTTLAPGGLVVTKIDETDAPSGLVHAPAAAKLPLAVLCFGQRVPEDISPATAVAVLDRIAPPPPARKAAR